MMWLFRFTCRIGSIMTHIILTLYPNNYKLLHQIISIFLAAAALDYEPGIIEDFDLGVFIFPFMWFTCYLFMGMLLEMLQELDKYLYRWSKPKKPRAVLPKAPKKKKKAKNAPVAPPMVQHSTMVTNCLQQQMSDAPSVAKAKSMLPEQMQRIMK